MITEEILQNQFRFTPCKVKKKEEEQENGSTTCNGGKCLALLMERPAYRAVPSVAGCCATLLAFVVPFTFSFSCTTAVAQIELPDVGRKRHQPRPLTLWECRYFAVSFTSASTIYSFTH